MAAGHLHATALAIGEPRWVGLAEFIRAEAVLGDQARRRSLSLAQRAADETAGETGDAQQVHGMLHLASALHAAALGCPSDVTAHLDEATAVAGVTGDGTFGGLHFGPRNVGVWRIALAVELGDGGRVGELARGVDVAGIPSAGRQAMFYADLGRGLATARRTREQTITALRQAEDLASQLIHANFYVRETVADLLGKTLRDAGGWELRGLAYRMGTAG
ncbi:MAG: hypothetical protein ACR2GH_03580 [Pseudonocardia sp.]